MKIFLNMATLFLPPKKLHISISLEIMCFILPNLCTPLLQFSRINTKYINTFKYHVSCIDGNISVRIIYFNYLFFHRRPSHKLCFLSYRPFVVNATFSTGLNDERFTGKKTQLVSGTTVEK